MLKKTRLYNFIGLVAVFLLLVIPFVIQQTPEFSSLLSIGILYFFIAVYLERSLTFRIVKAMDQLKWVNDIGLSPIYFLIKGLSIATLIVFISSIIFLDTTPTNIFPYLYIIILPLILQNNSVYIGQNFIYTQNAYICITEITSYERNDVKKGKHINYTEFIICIDKKTYRVKLQSNMRKGIELLHKILQDNEKKMKKAHDID